MRSKKRGLEMTKQQKGRIAVPTPEETKRFGGAGGTDGGGGSADSSTERPPSDAAPSSDTAAAAAPTAEALRAERDDLQEKLLRAQAECVNISKRLRQEHAESLKFGSLPLARDLLSVLDNLERTVESLAEAVQDDPVAQGLRLVVEEFHKALRQHGVEPIVAVGEPFDPRWHEAMMQDFKSDLPAGTVCRELQRGYRIHDRVLRPTKVAVASQQPEQEDAGPPDAPGEEPTEPATELN